MERLRLAAPSTTPPSLALRTTFLVPDLHCSSCASYIESTLAHLHPRPYSVSHSIVSHTVSVRHDPSLRPSSISRALADAGYEVDSVDQDPSSTDAAFADAVQGKVDRHARGGWFERVKRRMRDGDQAADRGMKRKRHLEHCEQCQKQARADSLDTKLQQDPSATRAHTDASVDDQANDTVTAEGPLLVVHSAPVPGKLFRALISIVGMTCSSCVGKVTETLEAKPWSHAVNVNLLTNSATVSFEGGEHAKELVEAIEDIGYEASLEQVDEVDVEQRASPVTSHLWRASFDVGGMTCSSCVGNITQALEQRPWVKGVNVNLLTNNATITFEGKHHLEDIQPMIEDLGYEAKLDDVFDLNQEQTPSTRRMVAVRIEGVHYVQCSLRIKDALSQFNRRVAIDKLPSIDDPILKIAYVPHSPDFTIRHILALISAADPAFRLSIYHPPTLEERARVMHARERRRISFRVLLSFIFAIPAFVVGIVLMSLVPSSNASRQYLMQPLGGVSRAQWALLIVATPVYFFAADVFHRRALRELYALWRRGSPTPILRRFYRFGSMNMLMSFGTTIAYFSSIAEMIIASTQPSHMGSENGSFYFDSVVFLTMFLLIGRLIEAYSKAKTGDAVAMLGKLRPTEAILVDREADGQDSKQVTSKIDIDLLEAGDVVRVLHGGSPPCDGIILGGETSNFDESSLTGESKLVTKTVGDEVYSGTINKGAPISVRVSRTCGSSMLDQIIEVVREGQARRAPVERVADAITSYFVPFVTLLAIATWFAWLGLGLSGALPQDWPDVEAGGWPFWSLQFAIAVFIIACPCGIGLAAPTALFVGGGLAATHGILVKGGGEAFQESSSLDCVVFDKTGTLSKGGEPAITDYEFLSRDNDARLDEKLTHGLLKAVEENSSHPIAKAVVSFCESRGAQDVKAGYVQEIPGKGMKGLFTAENASDRSLEVLVGNEALIADHGVVVPVAVVERLDSWKAQGKSVVVVAVKTTDAHQSSASSSWALTQILAASDPLRPESAAVVKALQRRGIAVWMLSGDNSVTAGAVGDMVGIPRDNIIAGVLPEQKADKIKYLQKSQKKSHKRSVFGWTYEHTQKRATVAMVGDGVNDSPALTVADVGIAVGSGSDVAISSAEFVLISPSLTSLLTLIDLSRAVFNRIKFNFAWALVYNIVALPVAAGVLYPVVSNGSHVRLDPVWASLAMALSSVSVVCSSLLLRTRLPYVGFRQAKLSSRKIDIIE